MAKPAHTRCTFEGIIGSVAAPLEHWSFNVNFPADAQPADAGGIVADGIAEECATVWSTSIADHMGSDVHLTGVKVAHINADGRVDTNADGEYSQGVWTGDFVGGGAPQAMPLQIACCVSLKTLRAGPTGKGRFYLPCPIYPVDAASKLWDASEVEVIAQDAVDLLNGLATVMTFAPQVVSSKGYMSEVVGVKVGRAPDTMRSRRRDLDEGYVPLPLA